MTRVKIKRSKHIKELAKQAQGACLRLYKAFLSLQTSPRL